jgi:hypothetical protein
MPIRLQPTPNPNARKFILPDVSFSGSRNFSHQDMARGDVDEPLALRLLALDGVYNVLLVRDFVTVNKLPEVAWPPLEAAVLTILQEYLAG